jgi:CheY-like chemotaxis protein
LRIIYAEDLRDLREVARISLSREGHTIECYENGALALDRISADLVAFDLLLTDHHMPVMNGIELVMAVKALRFPGKIIVFSSELQPAVAAYYRQLGVDHILAKPILPSELRRILAELFAARPA